MSRALHPTAALAALLTLTACGGDDDDGAPPPPAPAPAAVTVTRYDGVTDDLLTAGLGWDGLAGPAPSVSAPPTPAELRRLAIWTNYRALVDLTSGGGYGRLYGPNVAPDGTVDMTAGAGRIAGSEHITRIAGAGFATATLMVQIPATFNPAAPCIVTATSSGSRGVYGAISAAGEWALKRGCAAAYTDKGTGNGAHELATNTVVLTNGQTAPAATAGADSQFTANLTDVERTAFLQNHPHRYAFKHAHSQRNPERDWGTFTLAAIEFALERLRVEFPSSAFTAANTLVIADSVSNGGGAALAAAEQDSAGLIDAVVVGEPQINLQIPAAGVNVQRGLTLYPAGAVGLPLYDYTTLANLLQPCAAFAPAASNSPLLGAIDMQAAQNRCAALANAGFVAGADFTSQAADALARLRAAGWEPESDLLHASHWASQATVGIAVTYANAYARARVDENLCGFSFATTAATGEPAAPAGSPLATLFGVGNGIPPTGSPAVGVIYNPAQGGPIVHTEADGDLGFAGARCLRQLWTTQSSDALRVRQGVDEVRLTGNLHGKPAIIVHGRADALVPVNHTSRPYFGLNRLNDAGSRLSYIEVLNAQHFDAFLGVAGYDTAFVPLHYYNQQALDLLWNHVRNGAPLPPSQVVRPIPRAAAAPDLVAANLPPIRLAPAAADLITWDPGSRTVRVPN